MQKEKSQHDLNSEQDQMSRIEKQMREFEMQQNEFVFVANGQIIHAIKFQEQEDFDGNRLDGMGLKFASYNMNIVAAQQIDNFLYCLCKHHIKTIDRVPVSDCEAGVYVYGLNQMAK